MEIEHLEESAKTSLVAAIHDGRLDDVKELIPLANLSKQEQFFCLFNALFCDQQEVITYFLQQGFEFVNPGGKSCSSTFRLGVFNPNIHLIDALLKSSLQNLGQTQLIDGSLTPLLLIAFRGQANKKLVNFFESLLSKTDLTHLLNSSLLVTEDSKSSPKPRQQILLKSFLEYGSAVIKLSDFSSLLYLAFSRGNESIVKLLLSRIGPDDLVDLLETVLADVAFDDWRPELFRVILEYGSADIRVVPEDHIRALFEVLNRCAIHYPHVHLISNCGLGRILSENDVSTTKILAQHAIKMKVAGFYADQLPMVLFNDPERAREFQRKCENEVAEMRREFVGASSMTYYDVMTEDLNRLAILARNNEIARTLKSDQVTKRFPIFANLVRNQFEKGGVRSKLLEESINSCDSLLGCFSDLPYELVETILGYVDNTELRVFVYPRERAGKQNIQDLKKSHLLGELS